MSLDVYLTVPREPSRCWCSRCDHEHQDTRPSRVYEANVTHNLNRMADAAGIYEALWRPEEIGITKAGQLVEPLEKGLAVLVGNPEEMKKHNPPNGWGDYEGFVRWVHDYLDACRAYPEADIEASR